MSNERENTSNASRSEEGDIDGILARPDTLEGNAKNRVDELNDSADERGVEKNTGDNQAQVNILSQSVEIGNASSTVQLLHTLNLVESDMRNEYMGILVKQSDAQCNFMNRESLALLISTIMGGFALIGIITVAGVLAFKGQPVASFITALVGGLSVYVGLSRKAPKNIDRSEKSDTPS